MGRVLNVLSVTAVADMLARGGAELLSRGGLEVTPVVVVASVKLATQLERLGWLLGWLLLAGVVFQTVPLLFPTDDRDWPASLQGRSGVAAGAVAAGMFLESAIIEYQPGFQGTLPLDQTTLLVVFGVVLGSYVVAVGGDRPFEHPWVYDPGDLDVHLDDGRVTFGRYVLFVLVLGVLLSTTSLLFPLPELVVVGSQLAHYGGVSLWAAGWATPGGTDVGERLARGAAGVWAGVEYVPFLGYALLLLIEAFWFGVAYLRAVDLSALLLSNPLDAAVFVLAVATVILLTVLTVDRYLERLYLGLGERTELRVDVPRVPGLLVPAGLLWAGLELSRPGYPSSPPIWEDFVREANTVTGLEMTAASVAVLALGFALAGVALFGPRRPDALSRDHLLGDHQRLDALLPDPLLPDVVALPLSFWGLFGGMLLTLGPLTPAVVTAQKAGLGVLLVLLIGLYPATFQAVAPSSERTTVRYLLVLAGGASCVWLVLAVAAIALRAVLPWWVWTVVSASSVMSFFIALTSIAVMPFALEFRIPFDPNNRDR